LGERLLKRIEGDGRIQKRRGGGFRGLNGGVGDTFNRKQKKVHEDINGVLKKSFYGTFKKKKIKIIMGGVKTNGHRH